MAYSTGSDILDDEYNIFATGSASGSINHSVQNVSTIFGSGTGDKGYGQTLPVSPVSAGQDISATQWAALLNAISTAANHQGTSITAISNPSTGDDVEVLSALQQNLDDVFFKRLDCAATGTPITAGGTINRTTGWTDSVTATVTVTFSTINAMRYFFNAGGRLTVSASRTGGTAHDKNSGWTTLLNNMGTINLAAPSGAVNANIAGTFYTGTTRTGGGGSPSVYTTGTGIYDLTSSDTEIFKQYATAYLYTSNYVSVKAKVVGSVVTFTVLYQDDASDVIDDTVNGTLSTVVTAVPPATTYISNSWGTPTISGSQTGS